MRAVYHRGLNCHLAGILTAAAELGIGYESAYAALWSETDFGYDAARRIRISKRVYAHLEALGLRMSGIDLVSRAASLGRAETDCAAPMGAAYTPLDSVYEASAGGALLLVGMDSAAAPWSPVYGGMGDIHYFVAQGDGASGFVCCDPVYGARDERLDTDYLTAHAFELRRMYRAEAEPLSIGVLSEARAVLRGHPPLLERLMAEVDVCAGEGRGRIAPLNEYITAMINNRYLYARYIGALSPAMGFVPTFGKGILDRWEAVKNGLLKATVLKRNGSVIGEVRGLLESLLHDEMDMAGAVIGYAPRNRPCAE